MSDSLFASLSLPSIFGSRGIGDIAGRLGESEQSVGRGLESAIATVMGGLVNKAQDSGAMRQVIELASNTPVDVAKSITGAIGDSSSALVSGSKRLLSSLFGTREGAVAETLGRASGVGSSTASTLMTVAAPLVLGAIGKRVRSGGMTATGLTSLLQEESASIKRALPAGVGDLLPAAQVVSTHSVDIDPVVAQSVQKEKSSSLTWLWLLALAAVVLGLLWYFLRGRAPSTQEVANQAGAAVSGAANQAGTALASLGEFVKRKLPGNIELNVPEKGVEARLLVFIQDPSKMPDQTTWFDFDRLLFDTDSATLQPSSQEQLHNIAAILKAYPNVHIKIGGYTDNTGDTQHNLTLSEDRANSVMADLVGMGIAADRLEAKGYGDQYPVGDNSTEEGRAKNRRISMLVTQK